jgi:hypothetical protein
MIEMPNNPTQNAGFRRSARQARGVDDAATSNSAASASPPATLIAI